MLCCFKWWKMCIVKTLKSTWTTSFLGAMQDKGDSVMRYKLKVNVFFFQLQLTNFEYWT